MHGAKVKIEDGVLKVWIGGLWWAEGRGDVIVVQYINCL
jgi:hypothetical protein